MGDLAPHLPAAMSVPDVGAEADRAEALDRLCADVDVQIGLTVLVDGGDSVPGTKLRGVAEAAGLPARVGRPLRMGAGRHRRGSLHAAEPAQRAVHRRHAAPVRDQRRGARARRAARRRSAARVRPDEARREAPRAQPGRGRWSTTTGGRSTTPRWRRSASRSRRAAEALRESGIEPGSPRALALFGARDHARGLGDIVAADVAPAAVARRAAALREEIAEHNERYYGEDAPTISDAEYDALFRELRIARGRVSRSCARRTRRRSASAARAQPSSRRSCTACRCCRSAPRPTRRSAGAAEFDARIRRELKLAPDAPPVAYMAELKFDGLAMSLRYERGALDGRRDARRRRDRRGRDANIRTIPRDPAAACAASRRRCSKCAARST